MYTQKLKTQEDKICHIFTKQKEPVQHRLSLTLDGDVVHNVKFTGGCNGNLKAIPKLVEGLTVAQVEEKSVELNVDLEYILR